MAKLYTRKSDGTYVPYNPQSVTNIDVIQTTGNSVTAAMSQDAVTKELATKQDTLTDTDGSYGQRVAELEKGKQGTLTAGNGISIVGNTISAATDEEDIITNTEGKLQFKDRSYEDGMGYIILRKNKTFAEQVTQANTIYEIRYNFDLEGLSVSIPNGCGLFFNGGHLTNGKIAGNGTKTNFLDENIFSGDFYFNGEYHCFKSSINAPIVLSGKKCVFHNHFILNSYLDFSNCIVSGIDAEIDGVSLQITGSHQIAVKMDGGQLKNSKFTFQNDSVATMDKTKSFIVVYVDGNAIVEDCEFSDFNSSVYGNASCILVAPRSLYKISKCTFNDLSAHSDGSAGGNEGSFRGIITSFDYNHINLGFSEISECHFENIWSYTGTLQSPTEILDDCDGIYLAGRYNEEPLRVRDVVIRGCSFKNVRKRSIKIQQEGVTVENCSFDESGISSESYVECTIGAQNKDIYVWNCSFYKCKVCVNHMFSGRVVIDGCLINDCNTVVLEVTLNHQIIDIVQSTIFKASLVMYDSKIYGTGDLLVNVKESDLDLNKYGIISDDTKIFYENCILNTSVIVSKGLPRASAYFSGVHLSNCIINFDITGLTSEVSLIDFSYTIFIKDSFINVKVRHDPNDDSVKSKGLIFKSAYNVEGCIQIENVKITLDHASNLDPFAGINIKPVDDSFIRGINVDNTPNNVMVVGGDIDYKPIVYENIKLSNSQTLFLNACKNVILRNIGNEGVFSTLQQITTGYQDISVLLDGVFCLVKEAAPAQNKIFGIKTIGTRGYIYNGLDKTARRIFYLGGIATPLTYTNLDSDMSTDLPTLKPTDVGVTKYSTTHSKIVLWNGAEWINLDGTPL